jgi:hypothetical protein
MVGRTVKDVESWRRQRIDPREVGLGPLAENRRGHG